MAFGLSTKKDTEYLKWLGRDQYGAGQNLTEEGLGNLRTISGDYRDLIRKGGLTDPINREFDVQQGRISDDVVRAGRSFRANLMQQAAQNGGVLSPAAQAELAKENESDINEHAFTARNELSFEKSRVQQESVRALQDRVLQIADMIRTTGMSREQQGLAAQLAALQFKQNNKKMTLDALTNILRIGTSTASGGG